MQAVPKFRKTVFSGEWRQSSLITCVLGACSQFLHYMSFPSYLIKRTCKLQAYHSHTVQSEKHFPGYGLCSEAPLALGATRIISSSSTDDWNNDPALLLTALVHSSWTLPPFCCSTVSRHTLPALSTILVGHDFRHVTPSTKMSRVESLSSLTCVGDAGENDGRSATSSCPLWCHCFPEHDAAGLWMSSAATVPRGRT